jgi:hypothetical protein
VWYIFVVAPAIGCLPACRERREGGAMDADRFDDLTRDVGEQTDRRGMFKAAVGGALGLLGLGALQETVLAGKGFKNDRCKKNSDCKKGLRCNKNKDKCKYEKNCGGKKNDACQKNKDCCSGFKCKGKKCKKK